MNEIIINILINISSSIILLFILLIILRPNIKISHFICKNDGFQIKIINKSFFSAFDIKAELAVNTKRINSDGSIDNRYIPIKLVVDTVFQIPAFNPLRNKKFTPNALRFRTEENLIEILSDSNKSILFMITARHELTGITTVFKREFIQSNEIVEGEYKNGNSFSYIPKRDS